MDNGRRGAAHGDLEQPSARRSHDRHRPQYADSINARRHRGGAGDFAAAARQFEHAVELDSTLVQARVNWGAALLDSGENERAIAVLEKAATQNPTSRAWLNLANAQSRGGQAAAAERSFRAALQIEPDNLLARRDWSLLAATASRVTARLLMVAVGGRIRRHRSGAALRRLAAQR